MEREKEPSTLPANQLYETLKGQILADIDHSNAWRVQAKKDFQFISGPGQWTAEDLQSAKDQNKPTATFNKTLKFIRAVCGIEVNNRLTSTFLPSDVTAAGEVKANEMLASTSEWMDSQSQAPRAKSRAFRDLLICGMGWGESLMDFDEDPKGKYVLERCSPLEMGWDHNAREQNLADSKRRWRCREMLLSEARALIPGVTDDEDLRAEDLDASWAADVAAPPNATKTQEQKERREESFIKEDSTTRVRIIQVQWWEFETYYKIPNPQAALAQAQVAQTGQQPQRMETTIDVSEADYKAIKRRAKGNALPAAKLRRKVFKQAFLGGKILGEVKPCPRPDGFTLQCMTGEPDDDTGTWYGLTRPARDPQTWMNKFMSQLMHMVNTTAKGGILIEHDAVEDAREFALSYAKPEAATFVGRGAISKGKLMAKPGAAITGGVMQLWQMADQALPDVLGINLELMGMADRDQPGILEAQRKQAAMTILATLFDSLTSFEEERGRIKLHFIQTIIPDGVMIRIRGNDGWEAIPFIRDKATGKYDVIVDDAPTSANMKEKAWAQLQMILPAIKDMLTPKVVVLLLDYVPNIPSKLIQALKNMLNQPDPQAAKQAQLAEAGQVATIEKDKASAVLNLAKAAAEQMKAATAQFSALMSTVTPKLDAGAPTGDEQILGSTAQPRMLPPAEPGPIEPEQTNGMLPGGLALPGAVNGAI